MMSYANAFFGSHERPPLTWPDPSRFCCRCGSVQSGGRPVASRSTSCLPLSSKNGSPTRCDGCGREPDARGERLRSSGVSEVYCGWSDHGASAETLRSWKSAPGNEASCVTAGRLLGEMLLWQCEGNFLVDPALSWRNVLVPVPGWWGRRLRRGFDAPLRLAEGISEILGWPIWSPLCRVHGERMAGKSRSERRQASHRLFRMRFDSECKANFGSNLWLVDDLLASGSTSAAASRLLRFVRPHRVILVAANVSN
jgi:predicted amidophosphoribosyltransferase